MQFLKCNIYCTCLHVYVLVELLVYYSPTILISAELEWLKECLTSQEASSWATFHRKVTAWTDSCNLKVNRSIRSFLALKVMSALMKGRRDNVLAGNEFTEDC